MRRAADVAGLLAGFATLAIVLLVSYDVFMRYGGALRQARESLTAQPGQVGALMYLCGRWLGLGLCGFIRVISFVALIAAVVVLIIFIASVFGVAVGVRI